MKKELFLMALIALFAVSCGGNQANKENAVTTADTVVVRKYVGTIPGADVPGIEYRLQLNSVANDSPDGTFSLDMTYLEAEGPGKDKTFTSTGSWTLLSDDLAGGLGKVYRVIENSDRPDTTDYLFLGDSLVMLGRDMKVIDSPFNYTLKLEK